MSRRKPWIVVIIAFALLNGVFLLQENWFDKHGVDTDVLMYGNLILFAATMLSLLAYLRSMKNNSSGGALRGMYGSFMIKFFVCAIAAAAYIMANRNNINKPALIICMGLYVIYSVLEVITLQKMLKRSKHGKERSSR